MTDSEDYLQNPLTLFRINSGLTHKQLADMMGVSEEYIIEIEGQQEVSNAFMLEVEKALLKEIKR